MHDFEFLTYTKTGAISNARSKAFETAPIPCFSFGDTERRQPRQRCTAPGRGRFRREAPFATRGVLESKQTQNDKPHGEPFPPLCAPLGLTSRNVSAPRATQIHRQRLRREVQSSLERANSRWMQGENLR